MKKVESEILTIFNKFTPDQKKVDFIIALITDEKNINQNEDPGTYSLTRFVDSEQAKYIRKDNDSFIKDFFNLLYRHHSSNKDEFVHLILSAFQKIPESVVNMPEKIRIGFLIKGDNAKDLDQLSDLAFDKPLPHLSLQAPKKIPKIITVDQYIKTFSEKSPLDLSQFIILTLGILNNYKDSLKDFEKIENQILTDYMRLRYDLCLDNLRNLASGPGESHNKVKKIIGEYQPKEVDFKRNDTRRFFETRLSQYVVGSSKEEKNPSFISLQKIIKFFLQKEPQSPEQVEAHISIFADSYKDSKRFPQVDKYKKVSPKYATKDRITRKDKSEDKEFIKREDEAQKGLVSPLTIFSSNGGILLSSSPNFRDSILQPMRNRVHDCVDRTDKGYSWENNRQRSPYVGSISGHTFYVISMIEKYLEVHKKDPELSQDINNFFKFYVAVYVKRGFHSIHEVLDVLEEQQPVFSKYNVTLSFDNLFEFKHLEHAFSDSLVYTSTLCLRASMHDELLSKKFGFFVPESEVKTEIGNIDDTGVDTETTVDMDSTLDALEEIINLDQEEETQVQGQSPEQEKNQMDSPEFSLG